MQYHRILLNTIKNHVIACNTIEYHAIPLNTNEYYSIAKYHRIPCNTIEYHLIPSKSSLLSTVLLPSMMAFLKKNKQRIQIETDSTSFGHITTQQSQPLNYMTTSPNIWKFPCVYSAPRLEVSLNIKHIRIRVVEVEKSWKRKRRSEVRVHSSAHCYELSSIPFWAFPCQVDAVGAQQRNAPQSSLQSLVCSDAEHVADGFQH